MRGERVAKPIVVFEEKSADGAPFSYQKIIPTLLMETPRGNAFTVYGDGEQESEYVYIDDVAEVFARAICAGRDIGGKVVPVGSGDNISVNRVVDGWAGGERAQAPVSRRHGAVLVRAARRSIPPGRAGAAASTGSYRPWGGAVGIARGACPADARDPVSR